MHTYPSGFVYDEDKKYSLDEFIFAVITILPSFEWYDADANNTMFLFEPKEWFEKERAWSGIEWGGLFDIRHHSDKWECLNENMYQFSGTREEAIAHLESIGMEESTEYRDVYIKNYPDIVGHFR